MLMRAQRCCSSSSLQQRVESLQRHVDILRGARKDAVLSARELQRANEQITAQLNSLSEKLCSSKQLTQVTSRGVNKRRGNRREKVGKKLLIYLFMCLFTYL